MITVETVAQELESMKKDMSETKDMVKDIRTLLAGNPLDKTQGGLLADFKVLKKELDDVRDELAAQKEKLNMYKSYFWAVVTLVGFGALKLIIDILKG